jgi:hypothetical protein
MAEDRCEVEALPATVGPDAARELVIHAGLLPTEK